MPPEKKPVQITADRHFVEYEGTAIEIPKPIAEMTQADWVRLSSGEKSPLRKIRVDNQSFLGLLRGAAGLDAGDGAAGRARDHVRPGAPVDRRAEDRGV